MQRFEIHFNKNTKAKYSVTFFMFSLFHLDLHVSKHINFSITNQPSPISKIQPLIDQNYDFVKNRFCTFKLFGVVGRWGGIRVLDNVQNLVDFFLLLPLAFCSVVVLEL